MKPAILIFLMLTAVAFPQKTIQKKSDDQPGGIYLPAEGDIHTLFIFAQFPDDNYEPRHQNWKKGDLPEPIKEGKWFNEKWSSNAVPYSMTDYFNEMSFNKLKFTGSAVSVTAPQTRQWYLDNKKDRSEIHTDILKQLDEKFDFAPYDNWTNLNNFNHREAPDGKIDFIFFVWRNIHLDYPKDKAQDVLNKLGYGWFGNTGLRKDVEVDNGKRKVSVMSGITIQDYFSKDPFRFCVHEFGHFLLGGNEFHNGMSFWALLNGYASRSFMINSFERHRLGWITMKTLQRNSGPTDFTLRDFITTGDALRIEINANDNLYFYIENHQRISKWDYTSADESEKGVYVLRRDYFAKDNQFMKLIAADGKYRWEVVGYEYPDYYPKGVPVFKRAAPDRKAGYLDSEFVPFTYEGKEQPPFEIIFYQDSATGKPVENPLTSRGDGKDAFRPGFNNVFSPWSNPSSVAVRNTPTGIGFYLKGIINGTANLTAYSDSSLIGPPAKPDRPSLSGEGNKIIVSWNPNEEPDITGYRIYMADQDGNEVLAAKTDSKTTRYELNATRNARKSDIKISCVNKKGIESLKSEIGQWNY